MTDSASPHGAAGRGKLDEDDHDLLTFGEVGHRLRLEIAHAESDLASAEGDDATARQRVAALKDAAQRNSAQAINDANFEKFFGYPGKAKRNLDADD